MSSDSRHLEATSIGSPLSRRHFLSLASLAGAGSMLLPSACAQSPDMQLLRQPIEVPKDFVGMHFHRWPIGQPLSPAPTYNYGAVRSHDFSGPGKGIFWTSIHKAPTAFDWSLIDKWVDAHHRQGKTLVYTVYGTPEWLASVPAQKDPYWHQGGSSAPKQLEPLSDFIHALVSRYNSGGTRRIQFLEIWNEPFFRNDPKDFWIGSADQLASMGRAIYQAAKSADPGVRILTPGFTGDLVGSFRPEKALAHDGVVQQYLAASDGHGASGAQWCDAVAFHAYNSTLTAGPGGLVERILLLASLLAALKVEHPLYCTEAGFMPSTPFAHADSHTRAVMLRKLATLCAALGVRGLYFYSHDDDYVGNPAKDPVISQAIDTIHRDLAGQRLKQVSVNSKGSMLVETDTQRWSL